MCLFEYPCAFSVSWIPFSIIYSQVDVSGNRKAVVIHVPYRLRKGFRKIHVRLVRELEKKFSMLKFCIPLIFMDILDCPSFFKVCYCYSLCWFINCFNIFVNHSTVFLILIWLNFYFFSSFLFSLVFMLHWSLHGVVIVIYKAEIN